jgi:hypothetical protein
LVEGHKAHDVEQAIRSRWPELDPHLLFTQAIEHFANTADSDTVHVVGWALEAYRDLYRRLVGIGDYTGAMKAVSELVKLKRDCDVHD